MEKNTKHGGNVGKHNTRAVVLVCVKEQAKALKVVGGPKDGTGDGPLLGYPHCHTIAKEVSGTVDFKFPFDLGYVRGGASRRSGRGSRPASWLRSMGGETRAIQLGADGRR